VRGKERERERGTYSAGLLLQTHREREREADRHKEGISRKGSEFYSCLMRGFGEFKGRKSAREAHTL